MSEVLNHRIGNVAVVEVLLVGTLLLLCLLLPGCSTPTANYVKTDPAVPDKWHNQQSIPTATETQRNTPVNGVQPDASDQSGDITHAISAFIPADFIVLAGEPLFALVVEVLASNTAIQQAKTTAKAAYANAQAAGVADLPVFSVDLNTTRLRPFSGGSTSSRYSLGLGLEWDIDIWSKLTHQARAAALDYEVAKLQWRQTQLDTVASLVKNWFQLAEVELQIALLKKRVANLEQNLVIIDEGYRSGLRGSLDVYLAKATLSGEKARLVAEQRRQTTAAQAVEMLLGRIPQGTIRNNAGLSDLSLPVVLDLPSAILQKRPDVQAAYLSLAVANERVAVAHRNRFPRLSLASSIGSESNALSDLLDSDYLVWSVFAGVGQTLFDFGQLKQRQKQAIAVAENSEARYREVLLLAFQQVEDVLSSSHYLDQRHQLTLQAVSDYQAADELAFDQYRAGLVDYVTVLESQRRLFDAQSAEIALRRDILQRRMDLYLALGGQITNDGCLNC